MNRYYSVKEFASLLGVTERTVYNWIKAGDVKHIKIGNVVRIIFDEEKEDDRRSTMQD